MPHEAGDCTKGRAGTAHLLAVPLQRNAERDDEALGRRRDLDAQQPIPRYA